MGNAAIIVAAGRGTRLGGDIPKQYIPLNGPCALRRSLDVFLATGSFDWVQTVIGDGDAGLYIEAVSGLSDARLLEPVVGGDTRGSSVLKGLDALEPYGPENVLIHDAARPFIPPKVLSDVLAVLPEWPGACAALPVVDSLWRVHEGRVSAPIDRTHAWRAQTPQGFRFSQILEAYRAFGDQGTDDVAVAKRAGLDVCFVQGSERSYKITTQDDLERALSDTR